MSAPESGRLAPLSLLGARPGALEPPFTRGRHRPFPSWQTACPVCGRHAHEVRCPHDAALVIDVGVDEVADAALDLWAGRRSQPAQPA